MVNLSELPKSNNRYSFVSKAQVLFMKGFSAFKRAIYTFPSILSRPWRPCGVSVAALCGEHA